MSKHEPVSTLAVLNSAKNAIQFAQRMNIAPCYCLDLLDDAIAREDAHQQAMQAAQEEIARLKGDVNYNAGRVVEEIQRVQALEARVKELEAGEIEWTQFSGRLNTDIKFHSERADRLQAEVERLTIEVRNTQAARSMLAEKYDALDLRFKKASREPSFMNMVNFMTVTEERDTLTQQLAELRMEKEELKKRQIP